MSKKKFIGKLISIKYKDRPTSIYGIVIDYNDDWTLMHNLAEFVMDGYIILRHKNIEGYRRSEVEKFKEKVIRLKNSQLPALKDFPLTDLETILSFISKAYGIFSFELKNEDACYLGNLYSYEKSRLIIDYLNPRGQWDRQMDFKPNSVRVIEFDTDYINSLKLFAEKEGT